MIDVRQFVFKVLQKIGIRKGRASKGSHGTIFRYGAYFLCIVGLSNLLLVCYCVGQLKRCKRKQAATNQLTVALSEEVAWALSGAPALGRFPTPKKLAGLPWADQEGIVLKTTNIQIRNVVAPYNASILPSDEGFLLFFRYDIKHPSNHRYRHKGETPYKTHIAVAALDHHFVQTDTEFVELSALEGGEDPRSVKVGEKLYLFYNKGEEENPKRRIMHLASLDPKTLSVNYTTKLDRGLQPIEKNWAPFAHQGEDGQLALYCEYNVSPHQVLAVEDTQAPRYISCGCSDRRSDLELLWNEEWGPIRGGTGAQKIGDEYLGFFHSAFLDDKGISWYVMGAYTFEGKAPFRITRISKHPILFQGIYDAPIRNTARAKLRAIFPCGFAIESCQGKQRLHVACGENDSSVKVVTMDAEALLRSLKSP